MFKMTPHVLRNLFFKKATRRYPPVVREPFDSARGVLWIDIRKCTFCSVCAVKCPSQCLEVDKKAGTWSCDPFACVYCGICVDVCPAHCLQQRAWYRGPTCRRETIRLAGEPPKKDRARQKEHLK